MYIVRYICCQARNAGRIGGDGELLCPRADVPRAAPAIPRPRLGLRGVRATGSLCVPVKPIHVANLIGLFSVTYTHLFAQPFKRRKRREIKRLQHTCTVPGAIRRTVAWGSK